MESSINYISRSRVTAVSAPLTGDRLHVLPISAYVLRQNDEAIRVAVEFRLETPAALRASSLPLESRDTIISTRSIFRARVRANIPATKGPVDLTRTDRKRPDGLTLIPWLRCNVVIWSYCCPYAGRFLWSGACNHSRMVLRNIQLSGRRKMPI